MSCDAEALIVAVCCKILRLRIFVEDILVDTDPLAVVEVLLHSTLLSNIADIVDRPEINAVCGESLAETE